MLSLAKAPTNTLYKFIKSIQMARLMPHYMFLIWMDTQLNLLTRQEKIFMSHHNEPVIHIILINLVILFNVHSHKIIMKNISYLKSSEQTIKKMLTNTYTSFARKTWNNRKHLYAIHIVYYIFRFFLIVFFSFYPIFNLHSFITVFYYNKNER